MKHSIYKNKVLQDERISKLMFKPDGRIYYVYRITDLTRTIEENYYGSRISNTKDITEDFWNYRTSSKYNIISENRNNYKLKIIKTFDNAGDMIIYESYLHDFFDVKTHTKFWNKSNQLPWGFTTAGTKWDKDIPHFNIGKSQSNESNIKRSNSLKGRLNPMTEETKHKLSKVNKNKILSEETKLKISKNNGFGMLNKKHSEKTKELMSIKAKNRAPASEETNKKISEKLKGIPKKRGICPYCKKEGGIGALKRYHFDNCKLKGVL